MDIQTAIIIGGVSIIIASVLYLISVFGIKEKSYEEAIEEQKRLSQIEYNQPKPEKPKKEKKFKKWGRGRAKEKGEHSVDGESEKDEPLSSQTETKSEAEIYEEEIEIVEPKPPKPKKKVKPFSAVKPNISQKSENSSTNRLSDVESPTETSLTNSLTSVNDTAEEVTKQSKLEKENANFLNQEVHLDKLDQNFRDQDKSKQEHKPVHSKQNATAENVQAVVQSPSKRKKKGDHSEKSELGMTADKLVTLLKEAALSDEESQVLIDTLLTKQGEASSWTKKKDPVALLKKQLQEKEQALDLEQKQTQASNAKLRELRQEITQEKSRGSTLERNFKEKITQLQHEIQALQTSLKQSQEQHLVETSLLQSNLKEAEDNCNEEKKLVQTLQESNSKLQEAFTNLETEISNRNEVDSSKVQKELEESHINNDKYQTRISTMQQAQDNLQQQILQLEEHISKLMSTHKEDQASLKKELDDSKSKLREAEENVLSLKKSVENAVNSSSTYVEEKSSFEIKLKEAEKRVKDKEQELKELQTSLQETQHQKSDLANQLSQAQAHISELNQRHTNQSVHLEKLQIENNRLSSELSVPVQRIAGDGQEIPHQNGEFHNKNEEFQKKSVTCNEHERMLEEKETQLKQLHDDLKKQKTDIVSITEELEAQRKKNNELRSQVNIVHHKTKEILHRIFPELQIDNNLNYNDWLNELEEKATVVLTSLRHTAEQGNKAELQELLDKIETIERYNIGLEQQVKMYDETVTKTENMIKELQDSAESEVENWKQRLQAKEVELSDVLKNNEQLISEKKTLETSLLQLKGAEEATAELQSKLIELQNKLQEEENEKNKIEQKYDEVSKNSLNLRNQLENKEKELLEIEKEKKSLEALRKDVDDLRLNLEKEKKITKDLSGQLIKLNSLVKIGQDAVKAEQDVVKKLEDELQTLKKANANGPSVLTNKESESHALPLKSEKSNTKLKKWDVSGRK